MATSTVKTSHVNNHLILNSTTLATATIREILNNLSSYEVTPVFLTSVATQELFGKSFLLSGTVVKLDQDDFSFDAFSVQTGQYRYQWRSKYNANNSTWTVSPSVFVTIGNALT